MLTRTINALRPAIAVAITLLLLIPGFASAQSPLIDGINTILKQPFYNIAHMTNTPEAVNWALRQGANGVEIDLQFNSDGTPLEFKHGGTCDCSVCGSSSPLHVCSVLNQNCSATTGPTQLLNHIAKTDLALVYIDSKINSDTYLYGAGNEVIQLLETQLFGAGFRGIALVSAADNFGYIRAAAERAVSSAYRDRIYFGLDKDMSRTAQQTIDLLQQLPTDNLVYNYGVTSCLYIEYYNEISTGVMNQISGKVKMTGIWTIDNQTSMGEYISRGARAMVTNRPAILKQELASRNIPLATPVSGLFNLAAGKTAKQSSESWGGTASRAVDGNTSGSWYDNSVTHTAAETLPWWEVDLGADYPLDSVVINNRTDCCADRLNDFHLYIETADGSMTLAYDHQGAAGQTIQIPTRVTGRYITISVYGPGRYLSLAEVQVFKWPYENVALGRPATQSSVIFGGSASRAVDGNTNGNWSSSSVTHTDADSLPWWEVDLGSAQLVDKIIIYNRTDCCGNRLDNFGLQTSIDLIGYHAITYNYVHNGAAGAKIEIPIHQNARYVRITGMAPWFAPSYLSLAEVEVLVHR